MEKIALLGPKNAPTEKVYELIEIDGQTARVQDTRTGQIIRTHKTRLITKENKMTLQCPKCGKTSNTQSGLTLHLKKCDPTQPKVKRTKPPKTPSTNNVFDLKAFIKEHGGEAWAKQVKFGPGSTIKVLTNQILCEVRGYYFSINTYDGSLGKNNKGITKYPLKGRSVTYIISDDNTKKEMRGEKKIRKGKKTAEQIRKLWQKNGYKKV